MKRRNTKLIDKIEEKRRITYRRRDNKEEKRNSLQKRRDKSDLLFFFCWTWPLPKQWLWLWLCPRRFLCFCCFSAPCLRFLLPRPLKLPKLSWRESSKRTRSSSSPNRTARTSSLSLPLSLSVHLSDRKHTKMACITHSLLICPDLGLKRNLVPFQDVYKCLHRLLWL